MVPSGSKDPRWQQSKCKLEASKWESTNQSVTSQWLHPLFFIVYAREQLRHLVVKFVITGSVFGLISNWLENFYIGSTLQLRRGNEELNCVRNILIQEIILGYILYTSKIISISANLSLIGNMTQLYFYSTKDMLTITFYVSVHVNINLFKTITEVLLQS